MRHQFHGKKLNRDYDSRRSLFKTLVRSLIEHEQIKTTETKAKVIKRIFDKLLTTAKEGSLHARRLTHAFLQDRQLVNKLMDQISPLFKEVAGSATRIIRLGNRKGDNAPVVRLELTKKPEKKAVAKEAVADKEKSAKKIKAKPVKSAKASETEKK